MRSSLGRIPLIRFVSRWTPKFDRLLVVESGRRPAAERFLHSLYTVENSQHVDVLTCYGSAPSAFDSTKGRLFKTQEAVTRSSRRQIFDAWKQANYSAVCVLCTGDDIMTRWKWAIALRLPVKVLLVNESADWFWLDRGHVRDIGRMVRHRMGPLNLIPFRTLRQIVVFPFTLLFLLAFAAVAHSRRILRAL